MSGSKPHSWAESSDEEDTGGEEEVKTLEETKQTRGRVLNWADSSDENEECNVDKDSDDEMDSTSSESEDEANEGNIRHSTMQAQQSQQPSVSLVQGSIGGGPKPIEQMSKKERKALKEKELQDLNELLGEFGVAPEPPKPAETDDIDSSKGVEVEVENNIVGEGASQPGKVKRKRRKESKPPVQGNKTLGKGEDTGGDATIVAQPASAALLKPKLITGKKKPMKASAASSAAKAAAASVGVRKKKQDKKDKKKHYNQNPPNKN